MRTAFSLLLFSLFAALAAQAQETPALRAGDVFELRVSGVPAEAATDFALQYTIDQAGTVNIPLLGEVPAAGLRPAQLERALQEKLIAKKIFVQPTVVISVAPGSRHVSISGGVRNPQRLPWSPDVTLLSAIGDCGGLGDFPPGKGIRLIRDGRLVGVYHHKDLLKDPSRDPKLLPGDQVIVPE